MRALLHIVNAPRMKLGLAMFPVYDGIQPDELAVLAERRGFESLFLPEHSHIPAVRESHFDPDGGDLPREYWSTYDPFVALAVAAGATERLRLGTGICLLAQRDPLFTAKEVASLDRLSGGRFLFGIGAGWNREEMANHGVDFSRRFGRMREHVEAMKRIWSDEEASYDGRHVSFDRIWAWPKPAQRPHPPILVGGAGPKVLDRVLAYGDEWLPEPAPDLLERIAELRRRDEELGRPPTPVTVYGAAPGDVGKYAEAGVHRCVLWLPPAEAPVVRAAVDRMIEEVSS